MAYLVEKLLVLPSLVGLCGLVATGAVWAASPGGASVHRPPSALGARPWGAPEPLRAEAPGWAPGRLAGPQAAPARLPSAAQSRALDLSVPADWGDGAAHPASRPGTIELKDPDYREELPRLGPDAPQLHQPSRIEALAVRLHREGLPLARLWQNKNALLQLGLSPRGKPGIWLVQKVH